MDEILKPCPFCGNNHIYRPSGDRGYLCSRCGCEGHWWNSRPMEGALHDRIDELEKIIIEADAQYNTDKQPADISTAMDALVAMAAIGADALFQEPILHADLAAARQRIEELEEVNRWIPVGERLPPQDQNHRWRTILVAAWIGEIIISPAHVYLGKSDKFAAGAWICNGEEYSVTHWRLLPEPPSPEA